MVMKWILGTLSSVAFLMTFLGAQGIAQTVAPQTTVSDQSYMTFTLGFTGMGLAFAIGWWTGSRYTAIRMNQERIMNALGMKPLSDDDTMVRSKR